MNITKLAIENKPLTLTFLFVFLVLGLTTYNRMPRNSMPPFLVRFASIVTNFPGAGPERVELLISDKIEKVVQEIPEVDNITSESRTGISIVTVAIKESETDLRPIFDHIRRKVESIEKDLPDGIIGPNVNDEVGDVFGILVGITADGYSYAELKEIADDVRDGLIKIADAAKVEIVGTQEERIFIDYDNARLADLGLTQTMVQNTLAGTNIIYPGGDVTIGDETIILEPTGNFETIEDLERTIITAANSKQPIFLGDITRVYRGYVDPPESIVKLNGVPGLVLGISLKEGGNIIQLGAAIDAKLDELREIYPHGVDFSRVCSQDLAVEKSVNDFLGNLIQALIIVLAVMLVFLGLRTGLVVASLIPSAIVVGFLLMDMAGVGLDKVSLAALIIALGMLVDNAIVVSESILVKMEGGIPAIDAAIQSSRELMVPLLVSTLTTAAAFVSFYLAESVMGEIVGPIFVVVTVVLLASWVLSFTMIPLLCITFIKVKAKPASEAESHKFRQYYRSFLIANLKRPYAITLVLVLLFAASIWSMRFLPFIFMPDDDRNLVYADIEMPEGISIERTEEVTAAIEQFMEEELLINADRPEGVVDWSVYVGKGAPKYDLGYSPSEGSSSFAHLLMNTTSDAVNQHVIDTLDSWCFDHFPELTAKVSKLTSGGGSADPIAVRVSGKDPQKLYRIVDEIKIRLRTIEGAKNIRDDWGMRTKKLVVNVNQAKAQLAGVSSYDIAVSLRTVLSGLETSQFREGDKVIPIIMRNAQSDDIDIESLESLNIYAQSSGKNVPLKQVADIDVQWQAAKIKRRDQYKTITVTSGLETGYTARDVTAVLEPWLEKSSRSWGPGYSFAFGGEAEDSAKAMNAVIVKLPLAFFIILLLLIGQFNSYKKPIIVLLTIPLGFIGVVFGLLVARSYFGFFAFLGVISLIGIVINNAIVLLDRIKIEIDEFKRAPRDAIIEAAQQRFRPILLTTATTTLGLVPLWLGGGPMFEPMAIAIMFGLLFATIITLVFVPVLYKIFYP